MMDRDVFTGALGLNRAVDIVNITAGPIISDLDDPGIIIALDNRP
jgi:hypothetical protein